jgi:hypothetical protein
MLYLQILVSPSERQWAQSDDLLLVHPEEQTDPFILYIKGSILISRVKNFNIRFRARHFAGDASATSLKTVPNVDVSEPVDPRGSPAFIEIDHLASSFRASFPNHLKNPITDNVVDPHLYTATLMPHVYALLTVKQT